MTQTKYDIDGREGAHRSRLLAAEESWKFACWARCKAYATGQKYDRAVAARALRAARLAANVCLIDPKTVAQYRGRWRMDEASSFGKYHAEVAR